MNFYSLLLNLLLWNVCMRLVILIDEMVMGNISYSQWHEITYAAIQICKQEIMLIFYTIKHTLWIRRNGIPRW